MGAPKLAEFELVMADMEEKVNTKEGKVNAPDDAPHKTVAAQNTAVNLDRRRSLMAKGHSLELKR